MSSNLVNVTSLGQIKSLPNYANGVVVIDFFAPWSDISRELDVVFSTLASQHPGITFAKVEAEEVADVSEHYNIESVPTFVILNKGAVQDTLVGANPPELTKRVQALSPQSLPSTADSSSNTNPESALNERLKNLISQDKVMVFIKGTVDEPRCGFSNKILTILKETKVPFSTFDILSDVAVREGLKKYSSWPTYPQLYVNGKLVGGLDIVKELQAEGELIDALNGAA